MQLTIGSNRLHNTDGIVEVRGRRQILLEWGPSSSELLLTMDLYGSEGSHIARLWRNQWTFNDNDRFDFAANARGINLLDTGSSQVVLEARIVGRDAVVITQGKFYSSVGQHIDIIMEEWNGVTEDAPGTPVQHSTHPPFAPKEIASIRKAVVSSVETIACPRCGCPLTRERISSATLPNSLLVSCIICRRHLVVRSDS